MLFTRMWNLLAGVFAGLTAPAASLSGTTITLSAVSDIDLSGRWFGADITINGGPRVWYSALGAGVGAQSLDIPFAVIGATAGDLVGIDIGHSSSPSVGENYTSDTGLYISASITTPTISDFSSPPKVGETGTGTNGTALAKVGSTRSVLWLGDAVSLGDIDNSLTLITGDIGKAITFSNTVDGVSATSAATAAVVAGGVSQNSPASTCGAQNVVSTNSAWSHTIPSGSDIIKIDVLANAGGASVSTVTVGGVSASRVAGANNTTDDGFKLDTFILVGPASGSKVIVVTMSDASANWIAHATTYVGATGVRVGSVAFAGSPPYNGAPSVSVASATGDLCVANGMCRSPLGATTPGAGASSQWDAALFGNAQAFGLSKAGTAGSVTVNGTEADSGTTWATVGMSLQP